MPQFKMIPSREKILNKIPNYEVAIQPISEPVTVRYGDTVIAASKEALLVKETKHADVLYLPRSAMNMAYFSATDHSTYCPFKGHANYWQLEVDGATEPNIVWSYESPYEEVAALKDHVAFYPDRTTLSHG